MSVSRDRRRPKTDDEIIAKIAAAKRKGELFVFEDAANLTPPFHQWKGIPLVPTARPFSANASPFSATSSPFSATASPRSTVRASGVRRTASRSLLSDISTVLQTPERTRRSRRAQLEETQQLDSPTLQDTTPRRPEHHVSMTLEMLEKKESVLLKKAAAEVEKAKKFTKAKNKRAAIQCLKRKRLYEQQVEQLGNFQLRLHYQMILLEVTKATTETVDVLGTGAAAMKAMQKATNIDDVDKTMDEINEQTENIMKQISDALSQPIGPLADFDEDELEAELEELEGAELEEQILQPTTTLPSAPVRVPAGRQPVRKVDEDDELAELQREMAL